MGCSQSKPVRGQGPSGTLATCAGCQKVEHEFNLMEPNFPDEKRRRQAKQNLESMFEIAQTYNERKQRAVISPTQTIMRCDATVKVLALGMWDCQNPMDKCPDPRCGFKRMEAQWGPTWELQEALRRF